MRKSRLLLFIAVLAVARHAGAQSVGEFQPLSPSTPVLAVVSAWHHALFTGDYEAYLRTTSPDFIPEQTSRFAFGQLRRYVPAKVWTRGERQMERIGRVVLVSGCHGAAVFATVVSIVEVDGKPLVKANAGFSRIPAAGDRLPCQPQPNRMHCETESDCPEGHSCRSLRGGGTECRPRSP